MAGTTKGVGEIGEGIIGKMGDISNATLEGITKSGQDYLKMMEGNFTAWADKLKGLVPEVKLPDTSAAVQSLIPKLDSDGDALRNKLGKYVGVGGGILTAYGTRAAIPITETVAKIAFSRLAPKVALTVGGKLATKAIPVVGWAWLAADVGATIYELVSGKNIAGGWLGWGELINPEKEGVAATADKQASYFSGLTGATTEGPAGYPAGFTGVTQRFFEWALLRPDLRSAASKAALAPLNKVKENALRVSTQYSYKSWLPAGMTVTAKPTPITIPAWNPEAPQSVPGTGRPV